ncbi:hypothetical protein LN040_09225 [Desulfovibrio subterraneus]|jgi:uncharacterized protein HemX|uniref:DUF2802 domain-containing protein n=1 Tax=Desulfovibrio subterraneus TaxID=2718620 RepID=A0A7J0BNM8_9BACT|nr:hypothetical protein [Desulfovibrio subterraneus]WBF69245.1 hypothetical protein LN040_09225 [Desulfovibrio subterraneus]GFM35259.1 hypothetical protein DSM101010T_36240 [Desulfovibrio subterraneus]
MQFAHWMLLALSLTELLLLVLLFVFFLRLKRSESLLNEMQAKQETLLTKMHFNAQLEQELMESFAERQEQLRQLDIQLEARAAGLEKLIKQAESLSRSPQFLREMILDGNRKGHSPQQLARATGLSVDEVELILMKAGR